MLHPPRLCLVMCVRDLVSLGATACVLRVGLCDWPYAQSRVWRSRISKRAGMLGNRGRPGKGVAWFGMGTPPGGRATQLHASARGGFLAIFVACDAKKFDTV